MAVWHLQAVPLPQTDLLKKIVTILIMNILLFQLLGQFGIIAWFQINRKEITAKYCINKDKPRMHCNGKCYLAKQLKKIDAEHNSDRKNVQKEDHIVCFVIPEPIKISLPGSLIICKNRSFHVSRLHCGFATGTFQPPPAAV